MASITQDMRYRLSLIRYAEKYGVSKAAVKYKTNRQYIYRWKRRYGGSWDSLRDRSRRPHHHPNQHTSHERKLISGKLKLIDLLKVEDMDLLIVRRRAVFP